MGKTQNAQVCLFLEGRLDTAHPTSPGIQVSQVEYLDQLQGWAPCWEEWVKQETLADHLRVSPERPLPSTPVPLSSLFLSL